MLFLPCHPGLLLIHMVAWPPDSHGCVASCDSDLWNGLFSFGGGEPKPNKLLKHSSFHGSGFKGGHTGEACGVLRPASILCPVVGQSRELQDSGPTAILCKTSPVRIKCLK